MESCWSRFGAVSILLAVSWLSHTSAVMDKLRETHAKELHETLGLDELQTFRMPILVNLIFIGFDSHLQHSASISTKTLKDLLEPKVGDETFSFKHSYFLSNEYLTAGHRPETGHVVDDIIMDIQPQVVELAPLTHSALEAALKTFVRLESKTGGSSYQLDADKMGSLLESLLHATNLSNFYTLFVINPDRTMVIPDKKYGYRTGFSAAEIHQLFQEQLADRPVSGPLREDEIVDDFPQDHDPDHEAEPISRTTARKFQSLQMSAIREASETWASNFLILNRDVINTREKALKSGIPAEQCGQSETIVLKDENDKAEKHGHGGGDGHAHGDGHRINVQYNVTAERMARHIRQSGSDSEKQYLDLVLSKGPEVVRENCMSDVWQSRGRYSWIDLGAGPFFRTSPTNFAADVNTARHLSRPSSHLHGGHPRADVINHWATFCKTRTDSQAMTAAEADLCDALHALKVDPIRGTVEIDPRHAKEHSKEAETAGSMDIFLKHLKVTVQTALRHLMVRPVGAFTRLNLGRVYSKAPRIRFDFYITADHNSFRPTDMAEGGIDLMAFRHEMKKFALPTHEFEFHIVHLEKKDVETLWQATHSSVTDVQQYHGSQYGRVNATSLSLEVAKFMKARAVQGPDVFEVPIFLFSVARSIPLLFDGASQAVATLDGIVAFQSHHYKFPAGFSCNNNPVFRSLRDPLKAILAASAMFLTGLLPDYYSSPQLNEEVIRADYLWSVGDSPLSITSAKGHFSAMHRDLAHRQTVIAIAQQTLDILYTALDTLMELQQISSLKTLAKGSHWKQTAALYNKALQRVRKGIAQVSNLDLAAAIKTMAAALAHAVRFQESLRKVGEPKGSFSINGEPILNHLPGWFAPVVAFIILGLVIGGGLLYWKMSKASYKYRLPTYKNR